MANYNLVIDSKFKPFSYAELLAPVEAATKAHMDIEEKYSDLSTKANVWEDLANEEMDPMAYKQYKKYANDLRAQADSLAEKGLDVSSRQNMMKMRDRYSQEITPIENAYKTRKELQDEQRKALLHDPTLLFQRNFNNISAETSLDRFLENPNYDYGKFLSGNQLMTSVGTFADALSKELRTAGESGKAARRRLQQILPYKYRILEQHGFTKEEVLDAILGSKNASSILTGLVENAVGSTGVNSWGDDATVKAAYEYAKRGLWKAVGQSDYKYLDDNYNMQKDLNRLNDPTPPNHLPINPKALRSPNEISDANKIIESYKDLFDYDPISDTYKMNEKGYREYYRKDKQWKSAEGWGNYAESGPSPFRIIIDSMGGAQYAGNLEANEGRDSEGHKAWRPGSLGNLWKQYVEANKKDSYDTYRSTEYDIMLSDDYGKDYMREVLVNLGTNKNPSEGEMVEFNGLNGWKTIGHMDKKNLSKYIVSNVRPSKYGTTLILHNPNEDNDKMDIRIKTPIINKIAQDNVINSIKSADEWAEIINSGKLPEMESKNGNKVVKRDENGNIIYSNEPTTIADIIVAKELQKRYLDEMGHNSGKVVVGTKTSDIDFKMK